MATRNDYLRKPLSVRLARLMNTPEELDNAVRGLSDAALSVRAEQKDWSAKDVICHLRDIEELCMLRFHMMLAMENPRVLVVGAPPPDPERWGIAGAVPFPLDPDRWVYERQYHRNDPTEALAAFRRRRTEVLALLSSLSDEQWNRGSIHPEDGRVTFADWTGGMAAHDDNHLDQLSSALKSFRG